jgi:hypothetical protein
MVFTLLNGGSLGFRFTKSEGHDNYMENEHPESLKK